METNEKPTFYYIKGKESRTRDIMNLLKEKGGKVAGLCIFDYRIYVLMLNGKVVSYDEEDPICDFIFCYGTELYLPEKSPRMVLKWDDVEHEGTKDLHSIGGYVATEQQAKSVWAVVKISIIRLRGEEAYGEIVPIEESAAIICRCSYKSRIMVRPDWRYMGGILRFEKPEQAELFLENNRELVEEYLKTF